MVIRLEECSINKDMTFSVISRFMSRFNRRTERPQAEYLFAAYIGDGSKGMELIILVSCYLTVTGSLGIKTLRIAHERYEIESIELKRWGDWKREGGQHEKTPTVSEQERAQYITHRD